MNLGRTQTFRPQHITDVGKDVEQQKLLFTADVIDIGNSLALFSKDEDAYMNFTLGCIRRDTSVMDSRRGVQG